MMDLQTIIHVNRKPDLEPDPSLMARIQEILDEELANEKYEKMMRDSDEMFNAFFFVMNSETLDFADAGFYYSHSNGNDTYYVHEAYPDLVIGDNFFVGSKENTEKKND